MLWKWRRVPHFMPLTDSNSLTAIAGCDSGVVPAWCPRRVVVPTTRKLYARIPLSPTLIARWHIFIGHSPYSVYAELDGPIPVSRLSRTATPAWRRASFIGDDHSMSFSSSSFIVLFIIRLPRIGSGLCVQAASSAVESILAVLSFQAFKQ